MNETVKASDLPEHDIYYAVKYETGYPSQRFESLADCMYFCTCNQDYFPVTNNFECIEK